MLALMRFPLISRTILEHMRLYRQQKNTVILLFDLEWKETIYWLRAVMFIPHSHN